MANKKKNKKSRKATEKSTPQVAAAAPKKSNSTLWYLGATALIVGIIAFSRTPEKARPEGTNQALQKDLSLDKLPVINIESDSGQSEVITPLPAKDYKQIQSFVERHSAEKQQIDSADTLLKGLAVIEELPYGVILHKGALCFTEL